MAFDATDVRFQSVGKVKFKAHWQKANIREYTRSCNTVENIHEVIGDYISDFISTAFCPIRKARIIGFSFSFLFFSFFLYFPRQY